MFPNYLGIPTKAVYAVYGLLFLANVWKFRQNILKQEFAIWLASIFFLFCSTAVDLPDDYFQACFLLEEGLKFKAILLWLIFFCRTSRNLLKV